MALTYQQYDFTPIAGWSLSRYELFDSCKRRYFYQYYPRCVQGVPHYKLKQLKELTTFHLEVGNIVHDIIESFLKRLQKSTSNIDEQRFFDFARTMTQRSFSTKTFLECYYHQRETMDTLQAQERIEHCLRTFLSSPIYSWIFMKAVTNRENWMIEPSGYGETRLRGVKAYCKMDFLFPVDNEIVILDWKTGKKNSYKHSQQLIGYAAAASSNFGIPWKTFFPKVIYLYPTYNELELSLKEEDFDRFFDMVHVQTSEMHAFCEDVEKNIPLPMERFPLSPAEHTCKYCNYQGLCFPQGLTLKKTDGDQWGQG